MSNVAALYHVKVRATTGMSGAPVLVLDLLVNANTGQISGGAEISQALPPPYGQTVIPQVTGALFQTGLGPNVQLAHVTGEYVVSVPPPAIGSYLAKFSAALAVDHNWNGKGSFVYGNQTVIDATVTNITNEAGATPARSEAVKA